MHVGCPPFVLIIDWLARGVSGERGAEEETFTSDLLYMYTIIPRGKHTQENLSK